MHLLGLAGLCQCANAFKFRRTRGILSDGKLDGFHVVKASLTNPIYEVRAGHAQEWIQLFDTFGAANMCDGIRHTYQTSKEVELKEIMKRVDSVSVDATCVPDDTEFSKNASSASGIVVSVGKKESYAGEGGGFYRNGWVDEWAYNRRSGYFGQSGKQEYVGVNKTKKIRNCVAASLNPNESFYYGAGTSNGNTADASHFVIKKQEAKTKDGKDGKWHLCLREEKNPERVIIDKDKYDALSAVEQIQFVHDQQMRIANLMEQRGYHRNLVKVPGVSKGKPNFWAPTTWDKLYQSLALLANNGEVPDVVKCAKFAAVARYIPAIDPDSPGIRHHIHTSLVLEVSVVPARSFTQGNDDNKVVVPSTNPQYMEVGTYMRYLALNFISSFSLTNCKPCFLWSMDRSFGPYGAEITYGLTDGNAKMMVLKAGPNGNPQRYPDELKQVVADLKNYENLIYEAGFAEGSSLGFFNNFVNDFYSILNPGDGEKLKDFLAPCKYFKVSLISGGAFLKRRALPAYRLIMTHMMYRERESKEQSKEIEASKWNSFAEFVECVHQFFAGAHDELDRGVALTGPNVLKEVMTKVDMINIGTGDYNTKFVAMVNEACIETLAASFDTVADSPAALDAQKVDEYAQFMIDGLQKEDYTRVGINALDKAITWSSNEKWSPFSEYDFGNTIAQVRSGMREQAKTNIQGLIHGLKYSTTFIPDIDVNYDMHQPVCTAAKEFDEDAGVLEEEICAMFKSAPALSSRRVESSESAPAQSAPALSKEEALRLAGFEMRGDDGKISSLVTGANMGEFPGE